jgi:hypothetical protein
MECSIEKPNDFRIGSPWLRPALLLAGSQSMMGGSLRAGREGPGSGAALNLELPLKTAGGIEKRA